MEFLRSKTNSRGREEDPEDSRPGFDDPHAWNRWIWIWNAIFYALLLLSLLFSLLDSPNSPDSISFGRPQLALIALSFVFGFWYWFMALKNNHWIHHDTVPMLVYVAGALALWFALAWLDPIFHMLLFILYAQVYSFLKIRWAIPAAFVLSALIVLRGILQNPSEAVSWIIPGTFSIIFGVIFALWIHSIIRQSRERQRLIRELHSTREELAAEERRAGVLEERGRLAREIHDTLAQGFISIVTQLESADEDLDSDPEEARRRLDQARRAARENLIEARRLVSALRPEILEGSLLSEALERVSARFSESSEIPARASVTGEEISLPQEVQVTLLRAAQEALSNVARHAKAGEANVTLSYSEDLVLLDVQDDGRGFIPSVAYKSGGFGLRAMRERVERLGGELLLESEPGEGTTVAVQIPLTTGELTRGAENARRVEASQRWEV